MSHHFNLAGRSQRRADPVLFRLSLTVGVLLTLSACATVNMKESVDQVRTMVSLPSDAPIALHRSAEQIKEAQTAVDDLLAQPLSQADAVRLMLLNSPQMQVVLASHLADAAQAAQGGRLPNPVFSIDRLRSINELELGRQIAFGLIDWLTYPMQLKAAEQAVHKQRLSLGLQVAEQLSKVRQAWVMAVSAQQQLAYAQQVHDVGQASSELAKRMAEAGNFSALQRDTQQLFFAQAVAQLAAAKHAKLTAREALVRVLGLSSAQAKQLRLPDRLPDLPTQIQSADMLSAQGSRSRLDVQLAQASYANVLAKRTPALLSSITDVELELRRERVTDRASGDSTRKSGEAISIRLPIFDFGDLRREQLDAQALLALNQLESTVRGAESSLRESYSAYQTAFEVADHFQREVIPMRKQMSHQQLLRYNGMLIGVFDLLKDAREQVSTVIAAQTAQQQFWLADADLQASLLGANTLVRIVSPEAAASDANAH